MIGGVGGRRSVHKGEEYSDAGDYGDAADQTDFSRYDGHW